MKFHGLFCCNTFTYRLWPLLIVGLITGACLIGQARLAFAASAKIGAVQVCLAGLASEYSWLNDEGQAGKHSGVYSHSNGGVHIFRSKRGVYLCRIDRNRILLATGQGSWKTGKLDPFMTFEILDASVNIHRRLHDGKVISTSLSHKALLHIIPASKSCVPVKG